MTDATAVEARDRPVRAWTRADAPVGRAESGSTAFTPSPPCLVLRVGVTGHRPNRLPSDCTALSEAVSRILQRIHTVTRALRNTGTGVYADHDAVLRVISPLAEGSDRIVARCGLAIEYELQSPLPFAREEYEHDFGDAASRAEFAQLIARASAVLELDGVRENEGAAYEQVGRVVLAQSDLVIAIWNGESESGRGGTAQVVREAQAAGIPVLWIRPDQPQLCQLLLRVHDEVDASRCGERDLEQLVRRLVLVDIESDPAVQQAYFKDPRQNRRPLGLFTTFREIFLAGARTQRPAHRRVEITRQLPSAPPDLQREYAWADELATQYGAYYRDSFVANYLMGAVAVGTALVGYRTPWAVGVELLLVSAIISVTRRAQREAWHGRWLNYRLLAEQLRQAELLYPVGRELPSFTVPAHATSADPSRLWVSWLVRARVRELGMVSAHIDAQYNGAYRRLLQFKLVEQIRYHRDTARLNGTLAHRLHRLGLTLFAVAFVACILHLLLDAMETRRVERLLHLPTDWARSAGSPIASLLTLASAVLPAFGAAFAAISGQAEFGRVRDRSSAMVPRLTALLGRLRSSGTPSAATSGRIAAEAAEVMTAELLDWQITFRDKPLELPA